MNTLRLGILVTVSFGFLGFPSPLLAGDAAAVGIVKGTITVGGKPATGAVVSIEDLSQENSPPIGKPSKKIMDQRNQKFIPTVLAVRAGDTVDFPNNDKSWHNVYSKGGANDFDLGLYAPGNSRSQKFDKPGVSRILCNAHPNMEGFVVTKNHPFFATTDSRGNYEIKNVPLGRLRVEIWYPNSEVRSEPVPLVRDGEVFALNVDLKKR